MRRRLLTFVLVLPAVVAVALVAVPGGSCPSGSNSSSTTSATTPATAPSSGGVVTPASTARAWPAQFASVLDFLPLNPVKDGSADYTVALQTAIDASAGRELVLPDFPLRVSRRAGQNWCIKITRPIALIGVPGSEIRETQGSVQIIRCESTDDVRFETFTIRGKGGQGTGLAHGILQVWGGTNVIVSNVNAVDSDADGIVLANVRGARVVDCRALRASKSGIYLSQCRGGTVHGCIVEDGQGHFTAQGNRVGCGIQLSSNQDVVCSDNVVRNGVGIGILCDSNDAALPPLGCVVTGNRISAVRNATNMDVSCGIRCQNLALETRTQTLVAGNSIQACGVYGIYMENHGRSTVVGNTIVDSDRSGLVISTIQGLVVSGNTIRECDRALNGGAASILLIHQASGIVTRANSFVEDPLTSSTTAAVVDQSTGIDNAFEPQSRAGSAPPSSGHSMRGDVVWNNAPASGSYAGWICVATGTPGIWAPFGRID